MTTDLGIGDATVLPTRFRNGRRVDSGKSGAKAPANSSFLPLGNQTADKRLSEGIVMAYTSCLFKCECLRTSENGSPTLQDQLGICHEVGSMCPEIRQSAPVKRSKLNPAGHTTWTPVKGEAQPFLHELEAQSNAHGGGDDSIPKRECEKKQMRIRAHMNAKPAGLRELLVNTRGRDLK